MWVRPVLVCLVTFALGCASAPWKHEPVGVTPDELLAGAPLGFTGASPAPVDGHEVTAVSAEMRSFLDRHVAPGAGQASRLLQLASAIIDSESFRLEYDETTRTAAETFYARQGNCLSFSSMFVAMARQVGLNAYYQEVDTPPDWSLRDDAFVLNRHVNVLVDLRRGGERVVDFNMGEFRTSYDRRLISDARALAHYYNNVAVESMRGGDTASALLHFRTAADSDPSFSPAWTNLGILYLRNGHLTHAKAAYLRALKADGKDLVAMSNLASLFERLGDREKASLYRSRVRNHREGNPYYRFQLAREAFTARDYDEAIRHLKYAVRVRKYEDQFHFLLGLSYLKKGDQRAARRWLARAERTAATATLKRRYSSKIDRLLSAPPDPGILQ